MNDINTLKQLLTQKSQKSISIRFLDDQQRHAVLWSKDSQFPTDVISTNISKCYDWEGDAEIVNTITNMELDGYSIHIVPRELNDETGLTVSIYDLKLIIRK